jgi:hypothetical protein
VNFAWFSAHVGATQDTLGRPSKSRAGKTADYGV